MYILYYIINIYIHTYTYIIRIMSAVAGRHALKAFFRTRMTRIILCIFSPAHLLLPRSFQVGLLVLLALPLLSFQVGLLVLLALALLSFQVGLLVLLALPLLSFQVGLLVLLALPLLSFQVGLLVLLALPLFLIKYENIKLSSIPTVCKWCMFSLHKVE
jgi:hypothetical protein